MNKLKSKIKQLEYQVMLDRAQIDQQKWLLNQKAHRYITNYFAYQLVVGSFVFGFLLGYRNWALLARQVLSKGWVYLNTIKLINRYIGLVKL